MGLFWLSKRKQQELERERNAEINQAYLRGYDAGYSAGKFDGFSMTATPNQIREAFGLPPIRESEENK